MSDPTPDINDFNRGLIEEFRANDGKVSGDFAGSPLLLLTTTGAKSGQERVNPVVYTTDGDRTIVIASKGGAPTNPDWFHNLVANPEVTVEVPGETFSARPASPRATSATGSTVPRPTRCRTSTSTPRTPTA